MKPRAIITVLLMASAAAAPPAGPAPSFSLFITTGQQLQSSLDRAVGWMDFYTLSGDLGLVAYYAGRASVYREQLDRLLEPQP